MPITFNRYFNGEVQSLLIEDEGEEKFSIGVVLPGSWNFGKTQSVETITVTSGWLIINGQKIEIGMTCQVQANRVIRISTEEPSTYICAYK